jgi:hypothetical protein
MKKTAILFTTLISFIFASSVSVEEIKMMVHKIRDKRKGIDMNQLEYTENPFVSVMKDENVTKVVFKPKRVEIQLEVDAVINQKARINGKWMKVGQMIGDYNVTEVNPRVVTLKRDNNDTKKLFVYKKKNILDLKE